LAAKVKGFQQPHVRQLVVKPLICSHCGTKGVDSRTCPRVLSKPTRADWDRHINAKMHALRSLQKHRESQIKPKSKVIKSKFLNPYILVYKEVCSSALGIKRVPVIHGFIILTGYHIKNLKIKVKDASTLKLKVVYTRYVKSTLDKYMDLFCSIYKNLAELNVTRKDFFVNPEPNTKILLDKIGNTITNFIDFIVDNIESGGGTGISANLVDNLETIIEMKREWDTLEVQAQLDSLPKVATGELKVSKAEKKKVSLHTN